MNFKKMKTLKFDVNYIKKFILNFPDAKIYLGCDSVRTRKNKIRYATVVCIHYGGNNGCKIFGKIDYEKMFDEDKSKPINRMLSEVQRVIDLYNELEDVLIDRLDDVEIHLDINSDNSFGSNVAYGAAKGMVEGLLGIKPKFKPEAFAASIAADKYCKS